MHLSRIVAKGKLESRYSAFTFHLIDGARECTGPSAPFRRLRLPEMNE